MIFETAFRDKRVLVTGHTGFKGSWLCTWLHLIGAKVTGFALSPDYEPNHFTLLKLDEAITHVEGDIRDLDHVKQVMEHCQPEFVFHLAAQSLVRRSFAQPKRTFDVNVSGSVNLLEAIRAVNSVYVLIFITSDKCYRNREWVWGYRENDELGGEDPYSASKACAELALASYQACFFAQRPQFGAASVRAGNVIGGGDWAEDRIVPDCVRALREGSPMSIRNPKATRPWQHVLDPLGGYLLLASKLNGSEAARYGGPWNFGPNRSSSRTVEELVKAVIAAWGSGSYSTSEEGKHSELHETAFLQLNCDKAIGQLGWRPVWNFDDAVQRTVSWYKAWSDGRDIRGVTRDQIKAYCDEWESIRENNS